MIDSLTSKLQETLEICLNEVCEEIEISPAMLAHCALKRLDEEGISPVLVQWGCNLELRQMARGLLRRTYDPLAERADPLQDDMFTGLQGKYPCNRNGECVYVDRVRLSKDEREFNIRRLRKEGQAKLQHADALQAETDALDSQGFFNEVA